MDLEKYSKRKQFYTDTVPPLLHGCLEETSWNSLVDLGCGDGALLNAIHERGYFEGKKIYAIDLSENRIERLKNISQDITCLVKDVCNTNIAESSIDLLVSTQVIEHVADDGEMVKEIKRILSDTGMVYLSTVFKKRYAWYFYRCNNRWTLDPTHVREYTDDTQLLDLFEAHNLEVVASKKVQDGRPIADAILRRLRVGRYVYRLPFLTLIRKIRIPIPGYYIWELVLRKKVTI